MFLVRRIKSAKPEPQPVQGWPAYAKYAKDSLIYPADKTSSAAAWVFSTAIYLGSLFSYHAIYPILQKIWSAIQEQWWYQAIIDYLDRFLRFVGNEIFILFYGTITVLALIYPIIFIPVFFAIGTMQMIRQIRINQQKIQNIYESAIFIQNEKKVPQLSQLLMEANKCTTIEQKKAFLNSHRFPALFYNNKGSPQILLQDPVFTKWRCKLTRTPLRYPIYVDNNGPFEAASKLLDLKSANCDLALLYNARSLKMGPWQRISDRLCRIILQKILIPEQSQQVNLDLYAK